MHIIFKALTVHFIFALHTIHIIFAVHVTRFILAVQMLHWVLALFSDASGDLEALACGPPAMLQEPGQSLL